MNVALWDHQRRPYAHNSSRIVTVYGNAEVTPAVYGFHSKFIFY